MIAQKIPVLLRVAAPDLGERLLRNERLVGPVFAADVEHNHAPARFRQRPRRMHGARTRTDYDDVRRLAHGLLRRIRKSGTPRAIFMTPSAVRQAAPRISAGAPGGSLRKKSALVVSASRTAVGRRSFIRTIESGLKTPAPASTNGNRNGQRRTHSSSGSLEGPASIRR